MVSVIRMHGKVLLCALSLFLRLYQVNGVFWGTFNQARPEHDVGGDVRLLNSKTIQLENFSYDGRGAAVFVYYYRPGQEVNRRGGGFIIPVPGGQSDGSFPRSVTYSDATLTLPLPDEVDACDIGTLTIWCRPFSAIFNRVTLTRDVFENDGDPCTLPPNNIEVPIVITPPPLDNCRILDPGLHLRWRVNRDDSNVRFQLCGCLSSNPDVDQYMGFGVSGSDSATLMMGADPTITWVDTNSQPNAIDYHLSAYTQCVTDEGACPDTKDPNSCVDDATLIEGFRDSNQQCVTFSRPFTSSDVGTCDRPLNPDNVNQYIVWGVGGLGNTAFRHFQRAQATDAPIHLGREPMDECGDTPLSCATCPRYDSPRIVERGNATFRAVIGPSGNERGYTSITDLPSWGIAWYLNGMLIPELVVQRGSTYTFIVEGGDDPSAESAYHPLYITDSITGSRLSDSTIRDSEVVYAGFDTEGQEVGVGRLCELVEGPAALASRTSCQSLDNYVSLLQNDAGCSQGNPGVLTWTPDKDTPDPVYYQCATHKNLGWRIRVINEGDPIPGTSLPVDQVTVAVTIVVIVAVALFAALLIYSLVTRVLMPYRQSNTAMSFTKV